jgi:hypothetical protein
MSATKTYNGWTNYETWAVKLWMDNEQGSHEAGRELAREAWRYARADRVCTRRERAQIDLAGHLKDEYEEAMPEVGGVWGDLLRAAFSEVNWHEIAGAMLDDEELTDDESDGSDEE